MIFRGIFSVSGQVCDLQSVHPHRDLPVARAHRCHRECINTPQFTAAGGHGDVRGYLYDDRLRHLQHCIHAYDLPSG